MSERLIYSDAKIRRILREVGTIAMVGASPTWNRPSYYAMKYMQSKGYRMIPVNARAAGGEILGETVYATLAEVPDPIDMVQIFRNSEAAGPITDEAIAVAGEKGIKVVWMQLMVRNDAGRRPRRGGRARGGDGPLPEDRVRPAQRRAVLGRLQLRGHHQPPPPDARSHDQAAPTNTLTDPSTSATAGPTSASRPA